MKALLALYKEWKGTAPLKVETLAKAGSNRQYVRMLAEDGSTVIGVIGPSIAENRCFVYLAKHFTDKNLPMPQIYAVNADCSRYIQEDLGQQALYDALANARKHDFCYEEKDKALLEETLRQLAHIQVEGAMNLDFAQCITPICFDQQAAMFDLNYFKYSFLKTTDLPFDEIKLEADMQQLAADLVGDSNKEHYFATSKLAM